MDGRSRLRTIAGTFLVTSILWLGGLAYWWGGAVSQPREASLAGPVAVQPGQTNAASRPTPKFQIADADIPPLVVPVQGVQPSQLFDTFTQARENGARVHDAIDIPALLGTPVLAAASGTVEKLYTSNGGGITIYIRCDDRRFIHYYAHLDHYAGGLHEGQQVSQGEAIGAVGFTGNANPAAPHLHFAIQVTTVEAKWYEPSMPINPYPLLMRR